MVASSIVYIIDWVTFSMFKLMKGNHDFETSIMNYFAERLNIGFTYLTCLCLTANI